MTERTSGWNIDTEKLLCHMVLLDEYAKQLSDDAGEAFWRAFIVQNRETGEIIAKFRWNYKSRGRCWYQMKPGPDVKDQLQHLRRALENTTCEALEHFGVDPVAAAQAIQSFYPPDDEGHGIRTVNWLLEQDLIHGSRFEPEPGLET
jgi:hypothetical protein